MAHTCPECGMLCHCGGDIDDIDFGERFDCRCGCNDYECEDDYDDEDEFYENNYDDNGKLKQ